MLIPFGVFSAAGASGGGGGAAAYELISSTILGSTSASISLTSIPQSYKHLQLRMAVLGSSAGNAQFLFNGDSSSAYVDHRIQNGTSTVTSSNSGGSVGALETFWFGNTANQYTGGVMDILDYTSTTKNKTVRSFYGRAGTGGNDIKLHSGVWLSTSALNEILFRPNTGTWSAGTRVSLYGIKG